MHLEKSLQAIKNELVVNEEILRILQRSYPHLTQLSENQILNYFNVKSIQELDGHIERIKASQEPQNLTVQKNEICSCRDSHGETKDLYDSEVSAQKEANTLSRQNKLKLSVYRCPYGCGWHLTKG
jgi:hypothetical protein